MTELLKQVVSEVEQLPAEQQDAIAALIQRDLGEIHEREWDALFATPKSQRLLQKMAEEAIAEDDAGLTQESGERW